MDLLTYFAWGVLALMFCIVVGLLIWLGGLPGKIAKQHHHPQAAAIEVCGWLGILLGGIGWPIAMVWAFTNPASVIAQSSQAGSQVEGGAEQVNYLEQRVSKLESELAEATKQGGDNA